MILETTEPHNVAIAFTSEIQSRLGENQQLLNRAPPAQCFEPGSAHQYCIQPARQGEFEEDRNAIIHTEIQPRQ